MTHYYIGIDFGKTNVRFAMAADSDPSKLLHYSKRPYTRGTPEELVRLMIERVDEMLAKQSVATPTQDRRGRETVSARELAGIGIAVPAVVDRRTGRIAWGPDWEFMTGASLTAPLAEHYRVPVVADVDTVIPTWGENQAGIGRTCKRFAVLAWGTGLGAGIVTDGKVHEYPDNLFPEFGHSRVSDDDWPCKCGAVGCVDTLVCGGGIAKHGRLAVEGGKTTMLRELCRSTPGDVTSHMVFDAADRGDAVASAILDRVAVLLGRLCANIVLAMQPEKIVIVGGLAKRSPRLLARINHTMREGCWLLRQGLTTCEVITSELGDTAGVLGAIAKAASVADG